MNAMKFTLQKEASYRYQLLLGPSLNLLLEAVVELKPALTSRPSLPDSKLFQLLLLLLSTHTTLKCLFNK